jgi:protein-ribulosamine 3-kinase
MKLDSAISKLLNLDPSNTSVSAAGGGGSSSATTSKITTKLDDGTEKHFFLKTASGKDAEVMFEGISSYHTPPTR